MVAGRTCLIFPLPGLLLHASRASFSPCFQNLKIFRWRLDCYPLAICIPIAEATVPSIPGHIRLKLLRQYFHFFLRATAETANHSDLSAFAEFLGNPFSGFFVHTLNNEPFRGSNPTFSTSIPTDNKNTDAPIWIPFQDIGEVLWTINT